MNISQKEIKTTINGSNNTVIQYQNDIFPNQSVTNYSAEHSMEEYCARKRTFGIGTRIFFSVLGIIADIITVVQICIPLFIKGLSYINDDTYFLYLILLFLPSCFAVMLTALLKHEFFVITNTHQSGIYKNIYSSDFTYKLRPNKCPVCGGKIVIRNSSGTIIFQCTRSNNHSKKMDIAELDNLPLEQ